MYDFHKDRKYYFDFILRVTRDYILPFINLNYNENSKKDILDIGCAEGAVLKAFTDQNCNCVGIELSEKRIELAHVFMKDEINSNKVKFISRDIYDIDPAKDIGHKFDLILLKDVIEHIFNQDKFFKHLPSFLKPNGQVFFAFPPWYMPFGGHQQVLRSKLLSKLPYFHLLPRFIYKFILKSFKESESQIQEMLELKETGLSIERFERLCKNSGFEIVKKTHFLINPIYKYKFGLKPRPQIGLIKHIPYFRNFLTTGVYYLIKQKVN